MPSLADTLRRWLPHLDWQDGNGRDGVIDLATLDELTGSDHDVAGSILADYVDSLDTDLVALATALTDAGAEDVRRVAHGIKGAASTVGAREVAALAARLGGARVPAGRRLGPPPFHCRRPRRRVGAGGARKGGDPAVGVKGRMGRPAARGTGLQLTRGGRVHSADMPGRQSAHCGQPH
jgi:HPt (histidine-containing phosphotransfer) domain-containing protein